jgi:hypothetical protein
MVMNNFRKLRVESMIEITKYSPNLLSVIFTGILSLSLLIGCGGGGGGGSSSNPTTATGYFIDSPVQGLTYVSGGQSGTTDADGKFTYEVGKTVKFSIGAISLGEVSAKAKMTPVDMVANADASNTTVLKITRFLMTLDSDGDATNGITISDATKTSAQSASQIDFSTATDSTLTTAIASLTTNTLVTSTNAQTHLTSSIYGLYAGTYSGTYSGTDSGTWTVTINSSGFITGTGTPSNSSSFSISGQVTTSGAATFSSSGSTSNGASFSGTVDASAGDMSGTWSNSSSSSSGAWTGAKQTATTTTTTTTTTASSPSLAEAVDDTSLSWTTGGDANWVGQTTVSYFGGSASKSGAIGDSETTYIQTTVTGSGTLTFYWKVSSESNYDYLIFYIDGVAQSGKISGNVDWVQKSYSITSGSHTLKWAYKKDSLYTSGSDAGWLDKVVFTQSTSTTTTTTTTTTTASIAPTAPTGVTATGNSGTSGGGLTGGGLTPAAAGQVGGSTTTASTTATISWNSVSGATSYNIYWSTTSGVTTSNGTKITNAASPYTHTGLTSGATYYYVVTAVNSYGESSVSSQVSATF